MTCYCGRASRGFGFKYKQDVWKFCCRRHQDYFYKEFQRGVIVDFKPIENDAINSAHTNAGKWLADKGEFDLSKLSRAEQIEFCKIIVGNYVKHLDDLIPF